MYGGAFDPPHNAHVALARIAVSQLQLDELRICPTGSAWHRKNQPSAAGHRLAMSRLAFDALPKVVVDDREVRRAGPTYTIDTLRELQREHAQAQLFLIFGADQAATFTTWHEWKAIVRMATLCIAHRGAGAALPRIAGAHIVELELPDMPESATDIRRKAAHGEDISSLVPPGVAGYIASHHLYTQGN
jgi:nicotinate-nucleotide adenylyltransferase